MSVKDQIILNVELLRSPEKDTRKRATENLARLGSKSVLSLIPLLDDKDWIVRYRAAEALGMIRDERSVSPLLVCLKDEKDHVRYMSAKSLGEFKIPEIGIALIPLLKDENDYVRKTAAHSIKKSGSPTAIEEIRKALSHEEDPVVAERFREILTE